METTQQIEQLRLIPNTNRDFNEEYDLNLKELATFIQRDIQTIIRWIQQHKIQYHYDQNQHLYFDMLLAHNIQFKVKQHYLHD